MSKPPIKQKYIESPERMFELFKEYRDNTKAKPIKVTDWVGAKAIEVERHKERPLTMEGFSNYLFLSGVCSNVSDYFGNKGGNYESYSDICRAIREIIRQDQIEGGMAGIYNPSITQRLNGLADKSEQTVKTEQPLFPDASKPMD